MQSCCFANQTYCLFDVLVAVVVVVAKASFLIRVNVWTVRRDKKSGRCGEVAVIGGSTLL